MRKFSYLILSGFTILLTLYGCFNHDEEFSSDPSIRLVFSTDTIQFDTLLSDTRSITHRLEVFNTSSKSLDLSRIELAGGKTSDFKITVRGDSKSMFLEEILLGGDSMLILIEVNITPENQNDPYERKDSIIFEWNGNVEDIKLRAWGQDYKTVAIDTLRSDAVWTSERPYFLTRDLVIDTLVSLTIESGTHIYIEPFYSIYVQGQLLVKGKAEEKVLFSSSRFDFSYQETPGQWGGLYFYPYSEGNRIDHAIIKNAVNGIFYLGTTEEIDRKEKWQIVVSNTQITNMQSTGISGFTSDIYGFNLEVSNCGEYLASGLAGGNYEYIHCTFANEPSDFFRDKPSLTFSDLLELKTQTGQKIQIVAPLNLDLINTIVWGSEDDELFIDKPHEGLSQRVVVRHSLLKSTNQDYVFEGSGNKISQSRNFPGFYDLSDRDFRIDSLSEARDVGVVYDTITTDALGNLRDSLPDIGAYERKDSVSVNSDLQ